MRLIAGSTIFAIAALVTASAPAQDKEHPIEAMVKANLKDPTNPFTLLVQLKVKHGENKKFEAAFAKAVIGTRKEKGNKAYDLNRSAKSPNEYVVYERWQDLKALQEHLKAPHFATLLSEVGDLLDGAPDVKVLIPASE